MGNLEGMMDDGPDSEPKRKSLVEKIEEKLDKIVFFCAIASGICALYLTTTQTTPLSPKQGYPEVKDSIETNNVAPDTSIYHPVLYPLDVRADTVYIDSLGYSVLEKDLDYDGSWDVRKVIGRYHGASHLEIDLNEDHKPDLYICFGPEGKYDLFLLKK